MDVINSLIVVGNLILCIAFVYILIVKIEDSNNVKIPYLSLVLFLLFVFINLLTILSANVNISHKIFYFVSFVALVGTLYVKITSNTETFCNDGKPFIPSKDYEEYYKKVMNRGKNEYIMPNYQLYKNMQPQ